MIIFTLFMMSKDVSILSLAPMGIDIYTSPIIVPDKNSPIYSYTSSDGIFS